MTILQILILAVIQGAAELLPVSSSAHVIVAEKLLGLDPTRPELTLLLVMLHTGTMFAVLCFYWKAWKASFGASRAALLEFAGLLGAATVLTGMVGLALKLLIEKVLLRHAVHAEVELLFGNLGLIAAALAAAGLLILYSGLRLRQHRPLRGRPALGLAGACWMGAVQGLCLPFRGFSRSGATISTGILLRLSRRRVEEFSFALAVLLTPPIIVREVLRLLHVQPAGAAGPGPLALFGPGLLGMVLSFGAGLLALRWLSSWLEKGRWYLFGLYCLGAALVVAILSWSGF